MKGFGVLIGMKGLISGAFKSVQATLPSLFKKQGF
jgi:hypothetical protein